jgi:tetratricopeptide (TPR) repeat protein
MPDNLFSEYVKAYILFAKDGDLQQLRESLKTSLEKDQNRLDIAQELAKVCYFQQDYNAAYKYYSQYLRIKNALKMDVYPQEDIKIAYTCMMLGKNEEAAKYLEVFKAFADQDNSVYKHMNLCAYYAATGNTDQAMLHLEQFSQQKQFHYWTVLFLPIDPVLSNLRDQRDYKKYFRKIESNFNEFHKQLEKSLSEKGLI